MNDTIRAKLLTLDAKQQALAEMRERWARKCPPIQTTKVSECPST